MNQRLDLFNDAYDKGRSRVAQATWFVVQNLIFSKWWLPARLRVWLLRLFGARVGTGVYIRHDVTVHWPWNLVVGDSVWIGQGAWLLNLVPIEISKNVCISQNAIICTGGHDPRDPSFAYRNAPIYLDEGAWIGMGAMLLPGCHVGRNTVISAGLTVSGHIPPNLILPRPDGDFTGARTRFSDNK